MKHRFPLVCGMIAAVALIGACCSLAHAQEKVTGRKLAFLVGVKQYDHEDLKDLAFPENDVEELGKVLRADAFQTVILTTTRGKKADVDKPTAQNIRARLKGLLQGATKRDLMIVALAGHGIQPVGSDDSYFCPADANPVVRNDKPIAPQQLISIGEMLAQMSDSGIGEKLLVVDACRNDPSARSARRRGVDHVNVAALPSRTGVLLSCSQGEFSFEEKSLGTGHGVFFYHVIEGLKGSAQDRQGRITWDSLAAYVRTEVPPTVEKLFGKDGGEQSPNAIGNLRGVPTLLAQVASISPAAPRERAPGPTNAAERPKTDANAGEKTQPPQAKKNSPPRLTGTYSLFPANNVLQGPTAYMKISTQQGRVFTVVAAKATDDPGDQWEGRGVIDGDRGYYDWAFKDGKKGRTTFRIDAAGFLRGQVRGAGIDWDFIGQREEGPVRVPNASGRITNEAQ